MATDYVPYCGPIVTRDAAIEQNLKHYFTGKPCKRGHVDQRYVSVHSCVSCQREHGEKWFADNPERAREISLEWERENKERRKLKREPYKEKTLQEGRDRYERNKEARKITIKLWRERNPEIVRAIKINYRAKLLERGVSTND